MRARGADHTTPQLSSPSVAPATAASPHRALPMAGVAAPSAARRGVGSSNRFVFAAIVVCVLLSVVVLGPAAVAQSGTPPVAHTTRKRPSPTADDPALDNGGSNGDSAAATPAPLTGVHDERSPSVPCPSSVGDGEARTKCKAKHTPPANATDDDPVPTSPQRANAPARKLPKKASQLRAITVQTNTSPGWCRMLSSAALSGISITNLGWERKYAHRARPGWILEWIKAEQGGALRRLDKAAGGAADAAGGKGPAVVDENADEADEAAPRKKGRKSGGGGGGASSAAWQQQRPLDDWDVVMFVDGADSAFTGFDAASIHRRFTHMVVTDIDPTAPLAARRDPVPLLFNAEANCFHQQLFDGAWGVKKGKCLAAYKRYNPSLKSKWRYLNGGGWIGYVWAVKRFFADVAGTLERRKSLWCDQSVMGGLVLSRKHAGLVHLDYQNTLFLPTYHVDNTDFCAVDHADADEQGVMKPRTDRPFERELRLCHSKNYPAVLHFNGKSEDGRASNLLRRTMWFGDALVSQKARAGAFGVLGGATTELVKAGVVERVSVSATCPKVASSLEKLLKP